MNKSDHPLMICIVDDDDAVRAMMVRKLTEAGFSTVEAANGLEAIAVLKKTIADVAIVDLIMPEQEGLATISQIKREWPHIRVLAVSGGGHASAHDYLVYAAELGADDVLPKPFREAEFIQRVRSLAVRP